MWAPETIRSNWIHILKHSNCDRSKLLDSTTQGLSAESNYESESAKKNFSFAKLRSASKIHASPRLSGLIASVVTAKSVCNYLSTKIISGFCSAPHSMIYNVFMPRVVLFFSATKRDHDDGSFSIVYVLCAYFLGIFVSCVVGIRNGSGPIPKMRRTKQRWALAFNWIAISCLCGPG